jgi:hypothetical protein
MKAIFKKELFYKCEKGIVDEKAITLYEQLEGSIEWVDFLDGKDITSREFKATKEEKQKYNIETVFVINRYNDFAEIESSVKVHPDWVLREK